MMHIARAFFQYIGIYVCCVLFGTILLIGVCLIPSQNIFHGAQSALTIIRNEGIYPSVGLSWRKVTLDNFTDSLIINTAYTINSSTPYASAMKGMRYISLSPAANQIDHLQAALSTQKERELVGYERYWHGYLIFVRPLLSIVSFPQIRMLNIVGLYALCFLVLMKIYKRLGFITSVCFLGGFLTTDFFFIFPSIQFSGVFYIGLLTSMYLLWFSKDERSIYKILFVAGILTSYIDLLTAPLVALGIPLIIACLLYRRISPLILSALWGVGYGLMWATKWILFELTIGPGSLSVALAQIVNRTVTPADSQFGPVRAALLNGMQLIGYDKTSKIMVLSVGALGFLFFLRYARKRKFSFLSFQRWLIIACLPYGWYLVAANHSYIHVWYTYRAQFITVVGLLIAYSECIDWKEVTHDLRQVLPRSLRVKL